jgi:AcrR family transcriptional regulator
VTTPTHRRRLPKEHRRELILAAAARVFAERGYGAAAIKEIAAQAGVTKSVVYDHFGSKQELYVDLLRQHADALTACVFDRELAGSPADQFRDRTEAFFEFVERDRFAWRMLFRDPPAGDPTIEALHQAIHAHARDAIRQLVAGSLSVHADVPRGAVNEMAAQAIKSLNDGLAAWWYTHSEVPRSAVSAVATELAWCGLEQLMGDRTAP